MKTKLVSLFVFFTLTFCQAQQSLPNSYDTYFPVFKDGKMGYINKAGEVVININLHQPNIYDLSNWTGNYVVVKGKDKSAIYDRLGKALFPETYDNIDIDEDNKLIKVSNKKSEYSFSKYVGFFNFEGREIVPIKYESSLFSGYKFYDGLWQFEENTLKGFINLKGEVAIKPTYNWASDFKNNYAVVQLEEKGLYGVINTNGDWVIKPSFTSLGEFNKEGFAIAVKPSNKLENIIINIKGEKVASLKNLRPKVEFLSGNNFDQFGFCRVFDTVTKKEGFINQQGKVVVPVKYEYISNFSENGYATVNIGGVLNDEKYFKSIVYGKWSVINTNAVQQFEPISMFSLSSESEGLISFKKEGKWGFMNTDGKTIIETNWTKQPGYFINGLAMIKGESIKQEDSYFSKTPFGYVDKTGKIIWEIQL